MGITRRAFYTGRGRRSAAVTTLMLLSSLTEVRFATAVKYAKVCELKASPPVTLEYDAATGSLSLADDDDDAPGGSEGNRTGAEEEVRSLTGARRGVRLGANFRGARGDGRDERLLDSEFDADQRLSSSASTKLTITARSCPCDDSKRTYCVIDSLPSSVIPDSCGVPWSEDVLASHPSSATRPDARHASASRSASFNDGDNDTRVDSYAYDFENIGCFALDNQTVFIRNAWPVVVLWYGALFIFLLATSNGRYARAYLVHLLCPRFSSDERTVERILAQEDEMRQRLRTAAITAANLAEGPAGRYLVRTRSPRGAEWRRAGMTEEEERREATRWWIQQAEHLGILTSNVHAQAAPRRQRMEYVLRTRTFNAEKERERRRTMRCRKLDGECLEGSPSGESKATAETAESSLDDSEEDQSSAVPDQGMDRSETGETSSSAPQTDALSEEEAEVEEDETFECTICLTEIEDGEQVGVLPCVHTFHVDCLQQWIQRKNACPLCQVTEVAAIRPVRDEDEEADGRIDYALGPPPFNGNVRTNDAEEGGGGGVDAPAEANAAEGSARGGSRNRPWFAPSFLFPASNAAQTTAQRSPSGDVVLGGPGTSPSSPQRMTLRTTSSSSDADAPRNGRRYDHRRRRRRRDRRRQDDLWW